MDHQIKYRKLNRNPSHRWAMLRNMVTSLIEYERIRTTVARAKELRRVADWMVTLAKRGDLHARRQALAVVRTKPTVRKLFEDLGPRYQYRPGGFTRVMKVGNRRGDAAEMAIIEFVDRPDEIRSAKQVDEDTVRRNKGFMMELIRDSSSSKA